MGKFYIEIGSLLMNQLSDNNQQKLQSFIHCFVETPMAKMIFDDFDRLRYNQKFGGEQQCMLITGDPSFRS